MTERAVEIVPELIRGHGRDGRCKYDPAAKAELVRRCLQPGVSVAAMALAHGVNANLVRRWIMLALRDRTSVRATQAALVPVVTTAQSAVAPASMAATPKGESMLEVVLPGGTIRMRGVVEPSTLTIVLDCLQRPS